MFKKHNPPGFGYDGAFGHRGGSGGGQGALSQEAYTPSYWLALPRFRFSEAIRTAWFMSITDDAQSLFSIDIPSGSASPRIVEYTRTNDVFYTQGTNRTLSTSGSRDIDSCGVQTDGTSIWITYATGGTFTIDKVAIGSGNFASQTIAGSNAPPDTSNGAYLMGLLSSSRMAVWHQGSLYWGDISGSTVTFDDASTTLPSGFTLPTSSYRFSAMASDGTNYILVNPVGYSSVTGDLLKNVLVIDDTGAVQEKYLDIWVPGGKDRGTDNNIAKLAGIVKIVELWCPIFDHTEGQSMMCQSWELSAHTDDA